MKVEGTYLFEAAREEVWKALMDPNVLSAAIPGGEKLEKIGENEYEAVINIRIGPVQGKFDGKVELFDIVEPESYKMKVNGQGTAGFLDGEGDVSLFETDEGTVMSYSGDAQIGGKIAGVGQRLVDSSAKSIIRQGLESISAQVKARTEGVDSNEAAPAAVAAVAAPSASAIAATVAKDVTKDVVNDAFGQFSSNPTIQKVTAPEILPFTLGGAAIVLTLLFALISWLIAGA